MYSAQPQEFCDEIFEDLIEALPNVSQALLRHLANNWRYDALADMDISEIINCLQGAKPIHVITFNVDDIDNLEQIIEENIPSAENLAAIAGALLIITGCSKFKALDFYKVRKAIPPQLQPNNYSLAWYMNENLETFASVQLILVTR